VSISLIMNEPNLFFPFLILSSPKGRKIPLILIIKILRNIRSTIRYFSPIFRVAIPTTEILARIKILYLFENIFPIGSLCLNRTVSGMSSWIPFRLNTLYISLIFCATLKNNKLNFLERSLRPFLSFLNVCLVNKKKENE